MSIEVLKSQDRRRIASALMEHKLKNSKVRSSPYQKTVVSPILEDSISVDEPIPPNRYNREDHEFRGGIRLTNSKYSLLRQPIREIDKCDNDEIDPTRINDIESKKNESIANELKKRLSLPEETFIPKSFLIKHKDVLPDVFNLDRVATLSRIERRRSLFEIGFGRQSSYSKAHVLGAGTYSTVYKGSSRLTNKIVAIKEIHLEREEGVPFTAIREISLLKQLKHNNIITLHDVIYAHRTLSLVFEYVDRDLSHYMVECDFEINMNNVKLFLYQLLRGLKYCHDRKVLHRDIKPQNILISHGGELKLADFGLARAKSVPTKTFTDEVVTLWYRPPDVLLGNTEYGTSIDMWGVGCIFFEMAAGFTLFTGIDPKKQIECIFEIIGTPDEIDWPGIKDDLDTNQIEIRSSRGRDLASMAPRMDAHGIDLLRLLLKCNPRSRITARESMFHKYFSSLPPQVHELGDSDSIFSLPNVRLVREISCDSLHNIRV